MGIHEFDAGDDAGKLDVLIQIKISDAMMGSRYARGQQANEGTEYVFSHRNRCNSDCITRMYGLNYNFLKFNI